MARSHRVIISTYLQFALESPSLRENSPSFARKDGSQALRTTTGRRAQISPSARPRRHLRYPLLSAARAQNDAGAGQQAGAGAHDDPRGRSRFAPVVCQVKVKVKMKKKKKKKKKNLTKSVRVVITRGLHKLIGTKAKVVLLLTAIAKALKAMMLFVLCAGRVLKSISRALMKKKKDVKEAIKF